MSDGRVKVQGFRAQGRCALVAGFTLLVDRGHADFFVSDKVGLFNRLFGQKAGMLFGQVGDFTGEQAVIGSGLVQSGFDSGNALIKGRLRFSLFGRLFGPAKLMTRLG